MPNPATAIATYIAAKDGNRPWLMRNAFVERSSLEMIVKIDAISFPSSTKGLHEISDILVRRFSCEYENVYTFCLTRPPKSDRASFSCGWLVGMSRRDDGKVRVGCGSYDWFFATGNPSLVERLRITIDVMQLIEASKLSQVMGWLSSLPHPWCLPEEAIRTMPEFDELEVVRLFADRVR